MKRSGLRGPRGWSELKDNGGSWLTNPKKKEKVSLVVSCPAKKKKRSRRRRRRSSSSSSIETGIRSGLRKTHRGKCSKNSFCYISWLLSIKVEGSLGIMIGKIRGARTLFWVQIAQNENRTGCLPVSKHNFFAILKMQFR